MNLQALKKLKRLVLSYVAVGRSGVLFVDELTPEKIEQASITQGRTEIVLLVPPKLSEEQWEERAAVYRTEQLEVIRERMGQWESETN